jgi:hypothetical protein
MSNKLPNYLQKHYRDMEKRIQELQEAMDRNELLKPNTSYDKHRDFYATLKTDKPAGIQSEAAMWEYRRYRRYPVTQVTWSLDEEVMTMTRTKPMEKVYEELAPDELEMKFFPENTLLADLPEFVYTGKAAISPERARDDLVYFKSTKGPFRLNKRPTSWFDGYKVGKGGVWAWGRFPPTHNELGEVAP